MSEIPQDIRDKVINTVKLLFLENEGEFNIPAIEDAFALALLANEREVIERCAKIAEEYANTYCERISDGLATAIRETAR